MSHLTKTERRVFEALVNGHHQTGDLTEAVFGADDRYYRQSLRVHIHNIRRKLPGRIVSIGKGYRLVVSVPKASIGGADSTLQTSPDTTPVSPH